MSTLRRLIHGRVDPGDHRALKLEAAARGVSMTACVGECLREYFALRVGIGAVSTKSACSTSRYDAASCWARSSEEPADACSPRDPPSLQPPIGVGHPPFPGIPNSLARG